MSQTPDNPLIPTKTPCPLHQTRKEIINTPLESTPQEEYPTKPKERDWSASAPPAEDNLTLEASYKELAGERDNKKEITREELLSYGGEFGRDIHGLHKTATERVSLITAPHKLAKDILDLVSPVAYPTWTDPKPVKIETNTFMIPRDLSADNKPSDTDLQSQLGASKVRQQPSGMPYRVREPSIFYGTPEEDGQDWLCRFEIISDASGWGDQQKISYVKLYLEGTARQWVLVNEPANWKDFKECFLRAFRLKNSKFRLASKLRARRQGPNEPVETFIYDVLNIIRKVEIAQQGPMPEADKLDCLLQGLDAGLVEKMWPLVPTAIATVDQFLTTAIKFEQAKEFADSKARPDEQIAAITEQTPGLVTREEFDQLTNELKQTILGLKKELLSQSNPPTHHYQNPEPTAHYQPRTNPNPPRPYRDQRQDQSYFARNQPPTEFFQKSQPREDYSRNQRTSDGRPICNL